MEIWPKVISVFMLPPAILVLIALIGLIASFRWRLYGNIAIAISLILMYLLSIPLTSKRLITGLENTYVAINPESHIVEGRKPKAIIILGGGRYDNAPEYSPSTVSSETLVRLRFGARLHKATQLPILVSGGGGSDEITPEAVLTPWKMLYAPAKFYCQKILTRFTWSPMLHTCRGPSGRSPKLAYW